MMDFTALELVEMECNMIKLNLISVYPVESFIFFSFFLMVIRLQYIAVLENIC